MNYTHYVHDMYPSDAKITITSIMKVHCQLEVQHVYSSRHIPISSIDDPLHDALVVGVKNCLGALPLPLPEIIPPTGLSPSLLVQMDNCTKNNKSKYNRLIWSALTTKGLFHEVRVSFLTVGHTHEDVVVFLGEVKEGFDNTWYAKSPPQRVNGKDLRDNIIFFFVGTCVIWNQPQ